MDAIKQYYNFKAAKQSNKKLHPPYTHPSPDTIWFTVNKVKLKYDKKTGGYMEK